MKIKFIVLIFLFGLLGVERIFKVSEWFLVNYILLGVSIVSLVPEIFKLIYNIADKPFEDSTDPEKTTI